MRHLIFNLLDSCGGLSHLAQYRVENATVSIIFDLDGRVQANLRLEGGGAAVWVIDLNGDPVQRLYLIVQWNGEAFVPC